jgi:pimeloyl-ACP methyl ester carboxylesterase
MVINHNGSQLYYEVHGAGKPLLAVHGYPLSGKLWEKVTSGLARHHRMIIPDLRGFGQSQATPDVTMQTYVEDLVAVLDDAGARQPVTLMGMSMGGYVLFEFWRRHPEKVAGLILANTKAQADTPGAAADRHATADRVLAEGSQFVADSMATKLFAPSAEPALKEEWRGIMARSAPVGVAAALRAMAARPDSLDTLTTITVPTLIIAGREDSIIPFSESETMHQMIDRSMLALIDNSGHMTPVESPMAFCMAVQHSHQ